MAKETFEVDIDVVEIQLPAGEGLQEHEYVTRQVNGRLSERQSHVLERFRQGLLFSGAVNQYGNPVTTGMDAVRWMLDCMGDALEGKPVKLSESQPKGTKPRKKQAS